MGEREELERRVRDVEMMLDLVTGDPGDPDGSAALSLSRLSAELDRAATAGLLAVWALQELERIGKIPAGVVELARATVEANKLEVELDEASSDEEVDQLEQMAETEGDAGFRARLGSFRREQEERRTKLKDLYRRQEALRRSIERVVS